MDWRARASEVWSLPNLVSLSRLPLVAGIVVLAHSPVRYVLFVLIVLSDGLDGWLARRLDQRTELGALLDPTLDKLSALVLVIALYPRTDLPIVLLAFFFLRDAFVLALGPLILLSDFDTAKIAARITGKVVTNVQFAALVAMLVPHAAATEALLWLLAPLSAVAIADYTVFVARELTDWPLLRTDRGVLLVYGVVALLVAGVAGWVVGGPDAIERIVDGILGVATTT